MWKRLAHAATLHVQGKFLELSCDEFAHVWSRAIQSSSSAHLMFAINAAQDHSRIVRSEITLVIHTSTARPAINSINMHWNAAGSCPLFSEQILRKSQVHGYLCFIIWFPPKTMFTVGRFRSDIQTWKTL